MTLAGQGIAMQVEAVTSSRIWESMAFDDWLTLSEDGREVYKFVVPNPGNATISFNFKGYASEKRE